MWEDVVADMDRVRSWACNEWCRRKPGMVQTESEGRRGLLPEPAIEGLTRVEEAETETDTARETVGFIWALSSCSGRGLVEGGAEAPE
jgi:hypothetical protein